MAVDRCGRRRRRLDRNDSRPRSDLRFARRHRFCPLQSAKAFLFPSRTPGHWW